MVPFSSAVAAERFRRRVTTLSRTPLPTLATPAWLAAPVGPRVFLLGHVDIVDGGDPTVVVTQPRRVALLSVLAIDGARGFIRRDRIATLLWPDLGPGKARAALRKAVHAVRQVLGESSVLARGDEELRLNPAAVWCDVQAFDDAHANARHARAIELYRGPLLDGFDAAVDTYEHWLDRVRAACAERAVHSAWTLAQEYEARADLTHASHWAREVARLAGTDERRIRGAMEMLARSGNRADALRVYEEFAAAVLRDFDAEPSLETQAAAARIRAQ